MDITQPLQSTWWGEEVEKAFGLQSPSCTNLFLLQPLSQLAAGWSLTLMGRKESSVAFTRSAAGANFDSSPPLPPSPPQHPSVLTPSSKMWAFKPRRSTVRLRVVRLSSEVLLRVRVVDIFITLLVISAGLGLLS